MRSNPLSKAGHERRLSDVERPERLSAPQPSLEAWAAGSSGAAAAGSAEAAVVAARQLQSAGGRGRALRGPHDERAGAAAAGLAGAAEQEVFEHAADPERVMCVRFA
jgi:hypothetical protein